LEVGFYGLDINSLPSSVDAVVDYVKRYDPHALKQMQKRYGCMAPYKDNPDVCGALARNPAVNSYADETLSVIDEVLRSGSTISRRAI